MLLAMTAALRRPEPDATHLPEVRFHYVSRAAPEVPREDIARIVHASWHNNRRLGITGWLTFDGSCFEQVMEGRAEAISYLAASILADERHQSIDVKAFRLIESRSHDRWVFEGFDTALQAANMPLESSDLTNVVRGRFDTGR